jgi:hypothetical protein
MVRTDGAQPVGRGIGPALEARDVLAVLQRTPTAPFDLRERSLLLAGALLEFCGTAVAGTGLVMATDLLDSGAAWRKFEAICEAQGGLRIPGEAVFRRDVVAALQHHVHHQKQLRAYFLHLPQKSYFLQLLGKLLKGQLFLQFLHDQYLYYKYFHLLETKLQAHIEKDLM